LLTAHEREAILVNNRLWLTGFLVGNCLFMVPVEMEGSCLGLVNSGQAVVNAPVEIKGSFSGPFTGTVRMLLITADRAANLGMPPPLAFLSITLLNASDIQCHQADTQISYG
jgi:hypothetical protein